MFLLYHPPKPQTKPTQSLTRETETLLCAGVKLHISVVVVLWVLVNSVSKHQMAPRHYFTAAHLTSLIECPAAVSLSLLKPRGTPPFAVTTSAFNRSTNSVGVKSTNTAVDPRLQRTISSAVTSTFFFQSLMSCQGGMTYWWTLGIGEPKPEPAGSQRPWPSQSSSAPPRSGHVQS